MNKKLFLLLAAVAIASQSADASEPVNKVRKAIKNENRLGRAICDLCRVFSPTWTKGKAEYNYQKTKIVAKAAETPGGENAENIPTPKEVEVFVIGQLANNEQIYAAEQAVAEAKKTGTKKDDAIEIEKDATGAYFIAKNKVIVAVDPSNNNISKKYLHPIAESVKTPAEKDWKNQHNERESELHYQWAKSLYGWKPKFGIEKFYSVGFYGVTLCAAVKLAQTLYYTFGEEQKGMDFDEFFDEMDEAAEKVDRELQGEDRTTVKTEVHA